MSKIIIQNMYFHYAEYFQTVFENVNLTLDTDWRLGLIGRNGRGKSTFLKLLHGSLVPDKGNVMKQVNTEFFPYEINTNYRVTLDVLKECIGNLKTMEDTMEEIIVSEDKNRYQEYQEILEQYLEADGFQMESRILREIALMNLPEEILTRDYDLLSGGEKTRLQIIAMFLRNNSYVLLDEPTNHLDLVGKRLLAEYLKQKKGFLVVSHDRSFLDEVINHVLSINKSNIEIERGTFTSWKENKDKKENFESRTEARLVREIKALNNQSVMKRDWASSAEKTKNIHGKYERSSGSRAAQFMMHAKRAEDRVKQNLEEKSKLLQNFEVAKELEIKQKSLEGYTILRVKDLSYGYDGGVLFSHLNFKVAVGDRIWIRGKNGSGKSTLLKLIAKHLESEAINYFDEIQITESFQEPLWNFGYVADYIIEDSKRHQIYELCGLFDIPSETLLRPIETFSGGEKKKLDIARALVCDNQLILLDEPLNFMDIYFREQLEKAILQYQPTLIFIEHDEWFGNRVATKIITLD